MPPCLSELSIECEIILCAHSKVNGKAKSTSVFSRRLVTGVVAAESASTRVIGPGVGRRAQFFYHCDIGPSTIRFRAAFFAPTRHQAR